MILMGLMLGSQLYLQSSPQLNLTQGAVLTKSGVVARKTYNFPTSEDLKTPAVIVRGNNITLDFAGAVLRGTPATAQPDQRKGLGVEVIGNNVTIKNLKVHGYKVGLIARNANNLKIVDSDFSYNWKQHLKSTLEREDLSDWMSYHQNEKDEWLRFGAAVYLRNCDNFEVRGVRAIGGQNGLMITECDKGLIWNNNFSFLSSLGLGMYRSSDNRIMHNNIDWCVRGYSHGVYNRGQDSAGILIYEQSHRNVFAYNSVTHGGDGFFLWAGQTTMDTGKGGCNDNLLYGNDWSHAPTNGIEATFSRNNFVNNLLLECWHGIWGGYSYESKVIGNVFGLNAEAIAWEHGQDNLVENNVFHRDNLGIFLWSNPTQDPNWGYPKNRDTRSRDWSIRENLFSNTNTSAIRVRRTQDVNVVENQFFSVGRPVEVQADVQNLTFKHNQLQITGTETLPDNQVETAARFAPMRATMQPSGNVIIGLDPATKDYLARFDVPWFPYLDNPLPRPGSDPVARKTVEGAEASRTYAPNPLKGGKRPFLKQGSLRGRRYILVDEWGPYDFKYPLLWPRQEMQQTVEEAGRVPAQARATVRRFEILGPKGQWRVVKLNGVETVSARQGAVPGFLDITLPAGKASNIEIGLEYVGEMVTDYRGVTTPAGRPVSFGYSRFFAPIDWDVRWFAWNAEQVASPRDKMPRPSDLNLGTALRTQKTDRLDYAWGGSPGQGVPADRFITLADGAFEIPNGTYSLEVTTDDGVRVWVDDKLVIDQWHYQGPTLYTKELRLGGKHKIKVEHYEIDGYSALKVNLRPKK